MRNSKPKVEVIKSRNGGHRVYINGVQMRPKSIPSSEHCRKIYYSDKYIVKLDYDNEDYFDEQNYCEWRRWTTEIEKSDKKYFAPVIDYVEGYYLLQKRIYRSRKKSTDEMREIIESLSTKYNLIDVNAYYYEKDDEYVDRNWMLSVDGIPVIYDYGTE